VCEHVSTCRTAEDKDRSRGSGFLVSRMRTEGRNQGERKRQQLAYEGKVAATTGRAGREVVDVEVPES